MFRLILALLCLATPTLGEEVVVGLSQSRISITTNFDGSELLIFGAVKREDAISTDAPLHVVVTVAGPSEAVNVRRKARRFGIWVNTDAVEVDHAPSFYAIGTTGAWPDVLNDVEDLRHRVSLRRAIRSVGAELADSAAFTEALIRIREADGSYQTNLGSVAFEEQTLFSTTLRLPANLTEGDYSARFYLTRHGDVVDQFETTIPVQKVGLERFLFRLSREDPLLYGLMSLAIAISAGWGASALFRVIRT
ncbi:MAG: TIGR02186 family protein [Pseudomonadota bacterium]